METRNQADMGPLFYLFFGLFRRLAKIWVKVVLIVLVINVIFGGLATEYVVEFWASYFKGIPVDISFIPCAIAGLFLGEIAIPAAAFTWLFSFVL
jgi:hypothetical protein